MAKISSSARVRGIYNDQSHHKLLFQVTKRLTDILFSLLLLLPLFPLMAFICLLIVLESPGPPLYIQERLGLNGKRFKVIKLRSMRQDAEKNGIQWACLNDPRITKVGAFTRKTRMDELPQLINILFGDMSFVGPRPERPFFYDEFEKNIPLFRSRLQVKPGLTGLAQVNGGYDLTPEEKLRYDVLYISNARVALDIIILIQTIKIIVTGHGAR